MFAAVMIFLFANSFAQSTELKPEKIRNEEKSANTYLDLIVRPVSTNFNYGSSNTQLKDYKKQVSGVRIGATFQAGITPAFSLVSELYVLMKGGKLKTNNPSTGYETVYRLYPVELPVLLRFHAGRLYLNAGASVSYNITGTKKMEGAITTLSFKNVTGGFKRWDAGLQAGAGYVFPSKRKRIALDVRYGYGLTNISYDKEMYNRNLMINLQVSKPWKTNPLARKK